MRKIKIAIGDKSIMIDNVADAKALADAVAEARVALNADKNMKEVKAAGVTVAVKDDKEFSAWL